MFSKYPLKNVHAVPLPNGKDKMFGKEKRLGYLRALIADIEHPAGSFRAVTLHLDAHSSRKHRQLQMKIVLEHLETLPKLPTVIGGDWNTTTYNAQNAKRAILGYWRRVMMGVKNVVENHFPHPDRYFEKGLFGELEKRGFDYKKLNESGRRHAALRYRKHREKHESARLGSGMVFPVYLLGGAPRRRARFGQARLVCRKGNRGQRKTANHRQFD